MSSSSLNKRLDDLSLREFDSESEEELSVEDGPGSEDDLASLASNDGFDLDEVCLPLVDEYCTNIP